MYVDVVGFGIVLVYYILYYMGVNVEEVYVIKFDRREAEMRVG